MHFGISLIGILFSAVASAQLAYSPSQTSEMWIDYSYYDAEFIFIQNTGSKSVTLNFNLVDSEVPSEWHAAACTNLGCFTNIPESGSLGTLAPGEEAYFSINLTSNDTEGDATVSYAISDISNPEVADTIEFVYHANETGSMVVGPWVKVNYFEGTLTVFLRDDQIPASIRIFNFQGNQLFDQKVEGLYSYRLGDHEAGVYIFYIEDELGRIHKERLVSL